MRCPLVLPAVLSLIAGTSPAMSQTPLDRETVVTGLSRPVYVTQAPGDDDRLYIVEQHTGRVRVYNLNTGQLNATPFLGIAGHSTGSEQGLLGLVFHPDYENNNLFYINYTRAPAPGTSYIVEYQATSPDTADPTPTQTIITYTQPATNHNSGWLGFGPDGYLYIPTGDGGGSPGTRPQDNTSLLGKVLRIDVNGDDFPADLDRNYKIPPDNPAITGRLEIWAMGLRNPWRSSFDRQTGDFWIADVGQISFEEINFQPASHAGGSNYGWPCYEANSVYNTAGCAPIQNYTFPIHDYPRSDGRAVTGGYVYRGCDIPDFRGTYLFGDYTAGRTWSLRYDGQNVTDFTERTSELGSVSVSSFGEGNHGEIYMCDLGGTIYRVVADCYEDCDRSGSLDLFDLLCFLNEFDQQSLYADCDCESGFDLFDVLCYLNRFNDGC